MKKWQWRKGGNIYIVKFGGERERQAGTGVEVI
jgi:hypothetical protein